MCEYCEGVEGKPLASGTYFVAVIEPYHCRMRFDHCCDCLLYTSDAADEL